MSLILIKPSYFFLLVSFIIIFFQVSISFPFPAFPYAPGNLCSNIVGYKILNYTVYSLKYKILRSWYFGNWCFESQHSGSWHFGSWHFRKNPFMQISSPFAATTQNDCAAAKKKKNQWKSQHRGYKPRESKEVGTISKGSIFIWGWRQRRTFCIHTHWIYPKEGKMVQVLVYKP